MFRSKTIKMNLFWEFFKVKIFCLAIIIIAEIHKVRMIKGEDKES